MHQLSPPEVVLMFVALGTLLASARLLGEIARKLNQPSILGELAAGILLGPTVLDSDEVASAVLSARHRGRRV